MSNIVENDFGERDVTVTLKDLAIFRSSLIYEISELLDRKLASQPSKDEGYKLRSRDVRRILGISASTLQSYRITGLLRAKKVGGTYFYDRRDIKKFDVNNSK